MKKTSKLLLISAISNIFLSLIKIIFGILGKSRALIADGIHSISDLSTDFVAIIGNYFSNKPADKVHPYGHGKLDYITSVIIGTCIVAVSGLLFKNSLSVSDYITPNKYIIIVVLITIILKLTISTILIKTGKKENNNILISSGKESFGDVFSSILVLVLLILSQFSNKLRYLKYCDMVGSIAISIIIMYIGVKLVILNFSCLIGRIETDKEKLNILKEELKELEKIEIKKYVLLKYGTYYKLTLEIYLDGNIKIKTADVLKKRIIKQMKNSKLNIKYVTVNYLLKK